MKHTFKTIILSGLVGSLPLATQTMAQDNDNDEEVIELSVFEVSTTRDENYFASETLTGTRIRTEIKDLPFSVSVITSEFFDDFDFEDLSEALAFTASATDNDITPSAVNLRGFQNTYLMNGMSFFGLLMRSNVERVEVIKGPYAAIYGKTDPGGVTNYIPKQPKNKPSQSLTLNTGSLGYRRAMFSVTGPIINKKLLYTLNAGYNEKNGSQNFVKSWRQEYSGSLAYLFSPSTKLQVEYTLMKNYSSRPSGLVWIRDRASGLYYSKYTEDFYFNRSGPSSEEKVHQRWDYQSVYAFLDHKLNNIFSARIAAIWWDRDSPALAMGGGQYFYNTTSGQPNTIITGIRPSMSNIMRQNIQFQADLLADYKTGGVNHKTLLSLTWNKETDHSWSRALPDDIWNDPSRMTKNLDVTNPVWFYPEWSFDDYSNVTRNRKQITTVSSIFISHRADFFNKRVHAFIGGRYDWVDVTMDDYLPGVENPKERQVTDSFAPQGGLNFAITKNITAYASYSESYSPQSQTRTRSQRLLPNEEGQGFDVGIKTSFLDRKLNLTLGGFLITKSNVLQNYTNDEGDPVTDVAGEIKCDGLEIEMNYVITPSIQVILGASWMDNRITRNDEKPWTVGRLVARGPSPYNYGVAVIYRFKQGFLKGLSLRADVKGWGSSIGDHGAAGNAHDGSDGKINVKQPGVAILDAGLSYAVKASRKGSPKHTFSLNFKNITGKKYSTGNWIPKDGFSFSFGYRLNH